MACLQINWADYDRLAELSEDEDATSAQLRKYLLLLRSRTYEALMAEDDDTFAAARCPARNTLEK